MFNNLDIFMWYFGFLFDFLCKWYNIKFYFIGLCKVNVMDWEKMNYMFWMLIMRLLNIN